MSEKQKNPKSALNMAIGVIVTAALGATVFVVSPQMSARSEAKAATAESETIRVDTLAKVKQIEEQAADADNSLARLTELTKAFPTSYAQSQFLQMLEQAAGRSGAVLESVDTTNPVDPATVPVATVPGQPAPAPAPPAVDPNTGKPVPTPDPAAAGFPLAQINVTIQVSGSQQDVENFLTRLGSADRPVIVDSVSIAGAEGKSVATVTARTYLSRPLVVPDFNK